MDKDPSMCVLKCNLLDYRPCEGESFLVTRHSELRKKLAELTVRLSVKKPLSFEAVMGEVHLIFEYVLKEEKEGEVK